jgi:hypothetical protein
MVLVDVFKIIDIVRINDRKAINRILNIVQVVASIDELPSNIHGDAVTMRQEFMCELVNQVHIGLSCKGVLTFEDGLNVQASLARRCSQLGLLLLAQGNQGILMDVLEGVVVVIQGHELFPDNVGELSHV